MNGTIFWISKGNVASWKNQARRKEGNASWIVGLTCQVYAFPCTAKTTPNHAARINKCFYDMLCYIMMHSSAQYVFLWTSYMRQQPSCIPRGTSFLCQNYTSINRHMLTLWLCHLMTQQICLCSMRPCYAFTDSSAACNKCPARLVSWYLYHNVTSLEVWWKAGCS